MPTSERRSGRSPRKITLAGTSQKVAVHWRKIALAAVVSLIAPMYRPIIVPNSKTPGIIARRNTTRDRRTIGNSASPANRLRYSAIVSAASARCLVTTPLRLHSTAAASTQRRPWATPAATPSLSRSAIVTRRPPGCSVAVAAPERPTGSTPSYRRELGPRSAGSFRSRPCPLVVGQASA